MEFAEHLHRTDQRVWLVALSSRWCSYLLPMDTNPRLWELDADGGDPCHRNGCLDQFPNSEVPKTDHARDHPQTRTDFRNGNSLFLTKDA